MRTLTRTAGLTLAAVLGGAALGGCGGSGDDKDAKADSTPSASASASPSASPSASDTAIPVPKVVDGRIEATDGSFVVDVPTGWTTPDRGVPKPFVLALQDQRNPATQLVVSAYPEKGDALETATSTAKGLTGQKATCDQGTLAGKSVIDCHYDYQGDTVRKIMFPLERGDGSVLVLFQTLAETRAAGYAKARPVLESWSWKDGTRF